MAKHEAAAPLTRLEWLGKRSEGIGGSDAAAVLGLHPWKSTTKLWMEKTGKLEQSEQESERMYWGNRLEPIIIEEYCRRSGRVVQQGEEFATNERYPMAFCNTDGEIIPVPAEAEGHSGPGVLECKNTAHGSREDWDAGGPLNYQIQLQHNLMVRDRSWGSFAVLRFGSEFFWQDLARDERFVEFLAEHEHTFWFKHVQADEPPLEKGLIERDALLKMFPLPDDMKMVPLPPEAVELDDKLQALLKNKKEMAINEARLKQDLCLMIGENAYGVLPNGEGSYSWKVQTRTVKPQLEPKTSTFRVLRRHNK